MFFALVYFNPTICIVYTYVATELLFLFLFPQLVLWMMFGCKYVNQTLDMLGSQQAGDMGVQSLLADLQNMEDLLPN